MNRYVRCALLVSFSALLGPSWVQGDESVSSASVDRGRYLVQIAGCNDCHTAGYAQLNGQVPESEWLQGDALGWQGPWGTTYPPNLRLRLAQLTEDEWVAFAQHLQSRPPMPSFSLNIMTGDDLRAIYAFVRQLQPLGDPAPAYLPPGQQAATPVVVFPGPPPAD